MVENQIDLHRYSYLDDDFSQPSRLKLVLRFVMNLYLGFVALQLSDRLLSDSVAIIRHLRSRTQNCTFVIVGDSTYGDGDVDEISAQHVDCQKMVYFGNHNTKTKTSMNTLFIRYEISSHF